MKGRKSSTARAGALRRLVTFAFAISLVVALCAPSARAVAAERRGIDRIEHLIVIYQENRSFDSLYGLFPGANGIANAGDAVRQVDKAGRAFDVLPPVIDPSTRQPDPRFPTDLPVAPFNIADYVSVEERHPSPHHRYYEEQLQINGGAMDKFIAWTDAGSMVMGYYDARELPVGELANEFTLADNFFHSAFGNSFLNHFWLICACTPVWPDAPQEIVAVVDENGVPLKQGQVTPDGFAIGTSQPRAVPHDPRVGDPSFRVPPQTMPTIGDRLSEKGVSWAWYAGGWNDAIEGNPHPEFAFHHHPFVYFANYAEDTLGRATHLKDFDESFLADLRSGELPAVSFIKALGPFNEHPSRGNILRGQQWVADIVHAVRESPYWEKVAIIITYDENGGFWDHVGPPQGDRWGPGTRVPAIIVSPFAKRGFVDDSQYETISILKFIERRWKVAPLGERDAAANGFENAFDFSRRKR